MIIFGSGCTLGLFNGANNNERNYFHLRNKAYVNLNYVDNR